MKLKIVGLLLMAVILISGCSFKFGDQSTLNNNTNEPEYSGSENIRIAVTASELNPKIDQIITFSYSLNYEGKTRKIVQINNTTWEDESGNKFSKRVYEIKNNSSSSGLTTKIFKQDGEYTYTVAIYDCQNVERQFSVKCEDVDSRDLFEQGTPLEKKSVTVKVGNVVTNHEQGGNIGGAEDCLESQSCFYEKLENCSPATYNAANPWEKVKITIQGMENGECSVNYAVLENTVNSDLTGLDYTCKIPQNRLTEYEQFIADSFMDKCSGQYIDKLIGE